MNSAPDSADRPPEGEDGQLDLQPDLKAILARTVKRERKLLGISQAELAKRSGVHRTYVSDLERGARNPTLELVAKLAQALRISAAKLLDHQGEYEDINKTDMK